MTKNILPLVTVIMPCYNCENTFIEAIDSIIKQSYENLEIILCNDGSTDNTAKILESFEKQDNRIKVISNNKNIGLISSLNMMIDISSGNYIARMDSDDISNRDRIRIQIDNIIKYNVDGVGSSYITFGKKIKTVYLPENFDDIKYCSVFCNPFCHPSMLIKADILKNNKYSPMYPYVEDYELWSRLITSDIKLINIKETLLTYRIHSSQISSIRWMEQIPLLAEIKTNNFNKLIFGEAKISNQLYALWSLSIKDCNAFMYSLKSITHTENFNNNKKFILPSILHHISLSKLNVISLFKISQYFSFKNKLKLFVLYIFNYNKRKLIHDR